MEDVSKLADIFIGNQSLEQFTGEGEYDPFLKLVAEIQMEPSNERVYKAVKRYLRFIEKSVKDLRAQIDMNYKKDKFIRPKR